ncbi:hypothetical protein B551_0225515 [Cupriavidus sp. HPC(L)]|uniref:hypothetical protein n=1 Tax=Cupriavidus sp. HPC(L) TaxID=1217418 RepID=UPI000291A4A3|nr:hypothetical protein [Cupriavidus sp. HPC(L)]ESH85861.1 hypothetical protein B551_0225515 [Cupriavidus sp. HPC(L)]
MSEFFQDHPMLLFALEAGVALFLLIFIVVWTMGTAKKHPRPSRAPADHPSRAAAAAPGQANQASQANQAAGQAHSKDNAPGV